MKRRVSKSSETGVDPRTKIGEVVLHGTTFELKEGLASTFEAVRRRKPSELYPVYSALTGDSREVGWDHLLHVVGGAVQEEWYKHRGQPVPGTVQSNQSERVAAALASQPAPAKDDRPAIRQARPTKDGTSPGHGDGRLRAVRELLARHPTMIDATVLERLKERYPKLRARDVEYVRKHPTKEKR